MTCVDGERSAFYQNIISAGKAPLLQVLSLRLSNFGGRQSYLRLIHFCSRWESPVAVSAVFARQQFTLTTRDETFIYSQSWRQMPLVRVVVCYNKFLVHS